MKILKNQISLKHSGIFLSHCIDYWYSIKSMEDLKPENDRNNSSRNIAKWIMNGLYGKML